MGERCSGALSVDRDSAGQRRDVLGEDRFRITAPGFEQIVTFDEAERVVDALAERLE